MLREQVVSSLLQETAQAETHSHVAIAFCSGAFGFEGTGVAPSGFIVAQLSPIAVFGSFSASAPIGQALVGRAGELVLFRIIRQVLRTEDGFADQFGFAMLLLFTMKGVVFDIVAQFVFFKVGIVRFAAIACICRDVLAQAALP